MPLFRARPLSTHCGRPEIYPYKIDPGKQLTDYNTEQQAEIAQACSNGDQKACGVLSSYDPRLGAIYVYSSAVPATRADALIASLKAKFGPLGTAQMVAYILHCIIGDADVCEGLGPGLIVADPNKVGPD